MAVVSVDLGRGARATGLVKPKRPQQPPLSSSVDYGINRISELEKFDIENACRIFYDLIKSSLAHWETSKAAWRNFVDILEWNKNKMTPSQLGDLAYPLREDVEHHLERAWRSLDTATELLARVACHQPTFEEELNKRVLREQQQYYLLMGSHWTRCLRQISEEMDQMPSFYGDFSDIPPKIDILFWSTMATRYYHRKLQTEKLDEKYGRYWMDRYDRFVNYEASDPPPDKGPPDGEDVIMEDSPEDGPAWETDDEAQKADGSAASVKRRRANFALTKRTHLTQPSQYGPGEFEKFCDKLPWNKIVKKRKENQENQENQEDQEDPKKKKKKKKKKEDGEDANPGPGAYVSAGDYIPVLPPITSNRTEEGNFLFFFRDAADKNRYEENEYEEALRLGPAEAAALEEDKDTAPKKKRRKVEAPVPKDNAVLWDEFWRKGPTRFLYQGAAKTTLPGFPEFDVRAWTRSRASLPGSKVSELKSSEMPPPLPTHQLRTKKHRAKKSKEDQTPKPEDKKPEAKKPEAKKPGDKQPEIVDTFDVEYWLGKIELVPTYGEDEHGPFWAV